MPAYYPQFQVVYIDASGIRVPVRNVVFNVQNITTAASLGTKTSDNNGNIVEGSFSAAVGDVVEFSHGSFPNRIRFTLQVDQATAYTAPENDALAYVVDNAGSSTNDTQFGEIYISDPDNPSKAPEYLGRATAGKTNRFFYPAAKSKTYKLSLVPQDVVLQFGNQDLSTATSTTLSVTGTSASSPYSIFERFTDSVKTGVGGYETLYSNFTPALVNDGDTLILEYAGTFAANDNTKSLRWRYSTTSFGAISTTSNGGHWKYRITIIRTGANVRIITQITQELTVTEYSTVAISSALNPGVLLEAEAASGDVAATMAKCVFWPGSTYYLLGGGSFLFGGGNNLIAQAGA